MTSKKYGKGHTETTGRMFAYRSNFLRRATIGDEYPTTLLEGELDDTKHSHRTRYNKYDDYYLTEPKSAQSHSCCRILPGRSVEKTIECPQNNLLYCFVW